MWAGTAGALECADSGVTTRKARARAVVVVVAAASRDYGPWLRVRMLRKRNGPEATHAFLVPERLEPRRAAEGGAAVQAHIARALASLRDLPAGSSHTVWAGLDGQPLTAVPLTVPR